jgi:hypothetical protein
MARLVRGDGVDQLDGDAGDDVANWTSRATAATDYWTFRAATAARWASRE